jgi:ribonuclease BN (tRNA processing enzyme)
VDEIAAPAPNRPGRGGSLTVLGCDGSYPGPGGAASGYLVRGGGVTVWLDAGSGTFAALQRVADPGSVDAVVLSHEHPDHWSDVDSFAVWLRDQAPGRAVPVYAPPGLRPRSYFAHDAALAWREVEPSWRVAIHRRPHGRGAAPGPGTDAADPASGGLSLSFSATDHGPPTLAVRIDRLGEPGAVDDGWPALGYTADTGPDWSADELGPGIGVLLCEATYTSEHEGDGRHLSGRQAGALAASAGLPRLVLTHRRPSTDPVALADEAGEAFGRPVEQAAPGLVLSW